MLTIGHSLLGSQLQLTRSRAAPPPATTLVSPLPVRNTPHSVFAAPLSEVQALSLPLPIATCYALATAVSIVAVPIVSISTTTLALPRLYLHLLLLPVQLLSTLSPVYPETGLMTDAGCKP